MASMEGLHLVSLLLLVFTSSVLSKKTYIVQMKEQSRPTVFSTQRDWYLSSLQTLLKDDENVNDNLLYTYTDAYLGFAASLEPNQAEALKQSGSFLGVFEDVKYKLFTTRTPWLLKVDDEFGLWGPGGPVLNKFPDVIIGMLDTGIHPESMSFNDAGFPMIPKKWKGVCVNASDFDPAKHCNKKLIGARYYVKGAMVEAAKFGLKVNDVITPRDHHGHGTHTASTAAGSPVTNANLFGHANGTAQGMVPHARIASYKVCWSVGCMAADVLAAMDQAIKDGVDVVSMSLGGGDSDFYHQNPLAVGAFALMQNGIFLSAAAGNEGPNYGTLSNGAPWMMTVGAASLDRDFPVYVTLGNNQKFKGISISSMDISGRQFPLVYNNRSDASRFCLPKSLDPRVVRGKVVICDNGGETDIDIDILDKSQLVLQAGAAGMIICNAEEFGLVTGISPRPLMLPSAVVGLKDGNLIKKYAMSYPNPKSTLTFVPQEVNVKPSPVVPDFSSRGPYQSSLQILKPDVVAPGVAILASWRGINPSSYPYDNRKADFNIIPGTSMSCPHVSGIAALLKVARPDLSPSAIKSALITTANFHDSTRLPIRDELGRPVTPLAIGSGHIDPTKALKPILVYETTPQDYVKFICSLNYTVQQVQLIARNPNVSCSEKFADPGELNYPSFSVVFSQHKNVVQYSRELTNVGGGGVFRVAIRAPPTVSVNVTPRRLVFDKYGEKAKYQVTFVSQGNETEPVGGSITWMSIKENFQVRSPVVFMWNVDSPRGSELVL